MRSRGSIFAVLAVIFVLVASTTARANVPPPIPAPHVSRIDENVLRIVRAAAGETSPYIGDSLALVRRDTRQRLFVTVYSSDVAATMEALASQDASVTFADSRYGFVEAWVPATTVEPLAARAETLRIDPTFAAKAQTCSALPGQGSVSGEADCLLRARDARTASGLDGKGVTVGVISDGVAGIATSIATGDLPADTTLIDAGPASAREGRAMMEIVHDIAPAAKLTFSAGADSAGQFIASAQALTAAGCDIIVDDLSFLDQPWFEDGPVAKAVSDIVAGGVSYVSSAGNSAENHWAGDYVDGGGIVLNSAGAAADRVTLLHAHTFTTDATGAAVNYLPMVVDANSTANVFIQWADPWLNSNNDYDLYAMGQPDGVHMRVIRSTNVQNGAGCQPFESLAITNTSSTAQPFILVVNKASGAVRSIQINVTGSGALLTSVPGGSIHGQDAVPGVIAVGAISAVQPPYLSAESYSSQGPVDIRFPAAAQRAKPDVCGIDYVTTTVPGFNPFSGTSAAAPSVAGVVALMKQQLPTMTPAQIQAGLIATAIDAGPPGVDFITGAGRVDALNAVLYAQTAASVTPTAITMQGAEHGWFPAPATITLHGTYATAAAAAPWTASSNVPWLHISRTSGVLAALDTLEIWADTTGIPSPGATGRITFTLKNANPATLNVDVQLTLTPPPNVFVVTATQHDNAHPDWVTLGDGLAYANAHPGTVIRFNIPTSDPNFKGGVAHLQEGAYLDLTGGSTVIDGFSETEFVHDTNPNGPEIQTNSEVWIESANNVVRGIAIADVPWSPDPNYSNPGIGCVGAAATGNVITGCYVGLDADGVTPRPCDVGVYLATLASNNVVGGTTPQERNIIESNYDDVYIVDRAFHNRIVGNWIGVDAFGTHRVGASHRGVLIWIGSHDNTVGGSGAGEGNVISGHDWDGVGLASTGTTGNRIVGNIIGADWTGTFAIPNAVTGITAYGGAVNNVLGGSAPGEGNVISGNGTCGIRISGATVSGYQVMGNLIGVKANGLDPLPNGTSPSSLIGGAAAAAGILFDQGAHDNTVGGMVWETGKRNIVAGNAVPGFRIRGAATHNFIVGNSIGCTDTAGLVSAPNQGAGVALEGAAQKNVIGGMDPVNGTYTSGANQIGFNTGAGISMTADSSRTNTVSRNSIHDNGGLGIDLGADGHPATPADGFYNAPVLVSALRYVGFTLVSGTFDPGPDTAFVEFFTSPTADASGYGEGKEYVLSVPVVSAGPFVFALPTLDVGTEVTAVAIRYQNGALTDTSEFSNAVAAQDPPPAADHAPIIVLTQPNGGGVLSGGSTYSIQWSVDYLGGLLSQHIEYSLDSGVTWADAALDVDASARSYTWNVPLVQTGAARVRVSATDWAGRTGSAASAADFTIHSLLPWTVGDAATALRIAGGLLKASADDAIRYNVVPGLPASPKIDILDAIRIARKATGLDP